MKTPSVISDEVIANNFLPRNGLNPNALNPHLTNMLIASHTPTSVVSTTTTPSDYLANTTGTDVGTNYTAGVVMIHLPVQHRSIITAGPRTNLSTFL